MKSSVILGIESSCDETAAAIVSNGKLVSHTIASQTVHAAYGGVVPELAARAHQENIVAVVENTLLKAQLNIKDIDKIAVTQGPGLLGSLLVGVAFANGLKMAQNLPILGIHHTKAHILANLLEAPNLTFPCLGLVISGGHTQLMHVHSPASMELLGSTLDDAVGEAFDKIAKMMGMPYPGGTHIDYCAHQGNPQRFPFPKTKTANFNFSFSGIKTAFLYFLRKNLAEDANFIENNRNDLCASIQATLVNTLVEKIEYAMKKTKLTRVAIGGGVANNRALRYKVQALAKEKNWELYIPSPIYCTDNGAMIAIAAHYTTQNWSLNYLEPFPRMPL